MSARVLMQQLAVAACSFGVVAMNPVGLGVLEAPFAVNGTTKYIVEWHRTDLTSGAAVCALAMAAVTAGVWLLTPSRPSWPRILIFISALFWTWYAARTVALAGLVLAPLFAEALHRLLILGESDATRSQRTHAGRTEMMALTLGALVASIAVAVTAPSRAHQPGDVPLALDQTLDRLPAGTRVFNAYEIGGWIAWRHPDLEQYIDGLITPYTVSHVDDYARAVSLGPGWYRIVQDSRAKVALLKTGSPLASALERRGWRTIDSGEGYSVLEPSDTTSSSSQGS